MNGNNDLLKRRGLVVWKYEDKYWNPEFGTIANKPDGWVFVPVGDANLTRRIRVASHWIVKKKTGNTSPIIGTLVSSVMLETDGDDDD